MSKKKRVNRFLSYDLQEAIEYLQNNTAEVDRVTQSAIQVLIDHQAALKRRNDTLIDLSRHQQKELIKLGSKK